MQSYLFFLPNIPYYEHIYFRNQELVEKLKNEILEQRNKEQNYLRAAEMTKNVLNSNRATIIDLILKLDESDENARTTPELERSTSDSIEILSGKTSNQSLIRVMHYRDNITNQGYIFTFYVFHLSTDIKSKTEKESYCRTTIDAR